MRREITQRELRNSLPFDDVDTRSHGGIYAVVATTGREARGARGARAVDLMIAAVAAADGHPLYTRNPSDFAPLEKVVSTIPVQ